jgi:hypothetical protein
MSTMLSSFQSALANADWTMPVDLIAEMIEFHEDPDYRSLLSATIIEAALKRRGIVSPAQERIRKLLVQFYEDDPRVTLVSYRSNPSKVGYFLGVRLKHKYTHVILDDSVPSRFDATMHTEILNLIQKHAEMCRVIDATAALQRSYVKRRREEEEAVLID